MKTFMIFFICGLYFNSCDDIHKLFSENKLDFGDKISFTHFYLFPNYSIKLYDESLVRETYAKEFLDIITDADNNLTSDAESIFPIKLEECNIQKQISTKTNAKQSKYSVIVFEKCEKDFQTLILEARNNKADDKKVILDLLIAKAKIFDKLNKKGYFYLQNQADSMDFRYCNQNVKLTDHDFIRKEKIENTKDKFSLAFKQISFFGKQNAHFMKILATKSGDYQEKMTKLNNYIKSLGQDSEASMNDVVKILTEQILI